MRARPEFTRDYNLCSGELTALLMTLEIQLDGHVDGGTVVKRDLDELVKLIGRRIFR